MAPTPNPSLVSTPSFDIKPHACTTCHKRKVKCDRKHPCSNCIKHNAECEFRDPPPPRKRKRLEGGTGDGVVLSRVQRSEDMFGKTTESRSINQLPSPNVGSTKRLAEPSAADRPLVQEKMNANVSKLRPGRLISKEGRSIYVDNNFWKVVSNELQDAECMIPEHSNASDQQHSEGESFGLDEGSLLFGPAPKHNLAGLHPSPFRVFQLWQFFLENVNPLTKIIHAPTLQQRILHASDDLASLPEDLEALMFAIYCAALTSLDDSEVQRSFGETRAKLLAMYRQGAQKALVNAGLMKSSNMVVLQALVIFILSARLVYDPHTLWSLSGIGVRIAQRIGLHRDGSYLGLSVFETEMRRRLWWQVTVADAIIGQKSGSILTLPPLADTRVPLNVNDSDLDPDMKETPVESTRPTEMLFCIMRYEFGQWLDRQSKSRVETSGGYWGHISSSSIPGEEKERTIRELEGILEDKFMRFCDPSIPLHQMTMVVGRSMAPLLRLTAHHPRLYHEKGERPTQSEKDLLFDTCIRVAEYSNVLLSTKTRRYLWHVDYHFPWDILLCMLSELRYRTLGDQTAKAWHLIDKTCSRQYQELGSKSKSPLHLAIANLGIKAWAAHVAECEGRRMTSLPQPNIISVFWSLTQQAVSSASGTTQIPTASTSGTIGPTDTVLGNYPKQSDNTLTQPVPIEDGIDFSALGQMYPPEESPIDWGQWDELLQEYQQHEFNEGSFFGAAA